MNVEQLAHLRPLITTYKNGFDSGRWYDAREELLEALPELLDELGKLKGQVERLSKAVMPHLRDLAGTGWDPDDGPLEEMVERDAKERLEKILEGP